MAPGLDADLAVYGCYFNGSGTCTGVANIAPVGSVAAGNSSSYGQADLVSIRGRVGGEVLDPFQQRLEGIGVRNLFHHVIELVLDVGVD